MLLPFGSKVTSKSFVQTINEHLPSFLVIDILHLIIVMAFLLGFANALIYVPANATLQKDTDEQLRGRIYGFLYAFVAAVSFLPVALAGGLADILGVGRVLSGIGVGILIVGIVRFYPLNGKRSKRRI